MGQGALHAGKPWAALSCRGLTSARNTCGAFSLPASLPNHQQQQPAQVFRIYSPAGRANILPRVDAAPVATSNNPQTNPDTLRCRLIPHRDATRDQTKYAMPRSPRVQYDKDTVLTDYVWLNYGHLMTTAERF